MIRLVGWSIFPIDDLIVPVTITPEETIEAQNTVLLKMEKGYSSMAMMLKEQAFIRRTHYRSS
jgi:hypothetical protein